MVVAVEKGGDHAAAARLGWVAGVELRPVLAQAVVVVHQGGARGRETCIGLMERRILCIHIHSVSVW